ncbi:MAG: hypothetical protein LBK53_03715 [Heliobacteriaceae bacterium]|jgi:hypothetical protein|nr:hypothetical protein [Heliobacteriaceae bacterium]
MKKLLVILMIFGLFTGVKVFADDFAEALAQFNKYVQAANSYSNKIETMYSPKARIIRQVVKPNGKTVNATTNKSTYVKQMKLSAIGAKARGYKNNYTDIKVTQNANGYKVSALRQPAGEAYKLKFYQIWQKQPDGNWLITEELMQTKEQIFLKYADK